MTTAKHAGPCVRASGARLPCRRPHLHHGVCHEPGRQAADCCPHRRALPFQAPTAGRLHLQGEQQEGLGLRAHASTEAETKCCWPVAALQKLHAQQSRQGAWLALPLPAVAVLRLTCLQHAGKGHRISCDDPATAATAALSLTRLPRGPVLAPGRRLELRLRVIRGRPRSGRLFCLEAGRLPLFGSI